ncbi:LPS export ABC transporter ATP-binding protein [Halothiobacillus sp.]|uniref:LPS export ABC transporter ATP-binding protein n=1 Tax=Halothiobacillus sp. TaxID=1891311 RepID=UPI002AD49B04|nr:LPS export ABC transporter ATP-binding protein [Halothiobacillus sp.]
MTQPPVLFAESLVKHYGARAVVQGVSLEVQAGEIVGLLGPNGAGKTTSFYMIVGLVAADQGQIWLNGQDITLLPVDERAHMGLGYLPQEASVFRKLSVEQNIMAVLELRRDLSAAQRQSTLESLLGDLHIRSIRRNMGQSLSGGERRRVEIARALAANPSVILLDEPFAGVDPISVIDIQRIIKHLSERGIAVLITDHNVRETLGVCERAYIVSDGQILAEGTPQAILANEQVRAVYLGQHFTL